MNVDGGSRQVSVPLSFFAARTPSACSGPAVLKLAPRVPGATAVAELEAFLRAPSPRPGVTNGALAPAGSKPLAVAVLGFNTHVRFSTAETRLCPIFWPAGPLVFPSVGDRQLHPLRPLVRGHCRQNGITHKEPPHPGGRLMTGISEVVDTPTSPRGTSLTLRLVGTYSSAHGPTTGCWFSHAPVTRDARQSWHISVPSPSDSAVRELFAQAKLTNTIPSCVTHGGSSRLTAHSFMRALTSARSPRTDASSRSLRSTTPCPCSISPQRQPSLRPSGARRADATTAPARQSTATRRAPHGGTLCVP